MASPKDHTRLSKLLSLVLRHDPAFLGIRLDEEGWTDVALLLRKLNEKGECVDRNLLQEIVDTNAKKRFAFSADGSRIRASQGHSVEVSLGYPPETPPPYLYHGTADRFLESIRKTGLEKRERHQVHLSPDTATARMVGTRHGRPVVLRIAAMRMHEAGHLFYRSANGVWLTDAVPPQYIEPLPTGLE